MDIESLAQAAGRHHRALDMPARTPRAPRRLPARLARLDALPQDEIQRVLLGFINFDPRANFQVFDFLARQLAVTDKLADPVVHVAITGRVGKTLVDQGLNHLVHAGDMPGSTRLLIRAQHIQTRLVFVHGRDHALNQRFKRFAVLVGTLDNLVIDVSDIAHVGDVIAAMAQPARHHIERHHHPRMTDMTEVVNRHAAHIHAHLVTHQRFEDIFAFGQRVVDREHRGSLENHGPVRWPGL